LGLPDTLKKVDGAMRWGYNDKTYFFSGMDSNISIIDTFICFRNNVLEV
jgi:hypothetical protein